MVVDDAAVPWFWMSTSRTHTHTRAHPELILRSLCVDSFTILGVVLSHFPKVDWVKNEKIDHGNEILQRLRISCAA